MAKKRSAFGTEFAAARAKGLDTFSFKGKSYNTRRAGEDKPNESGTKTTTLARKTTAIPQPRPSVSGILPETTAAIPASRQGAEIQTLAARKTPPARPDLVAKFTKAATPTPPPMQASSAAQEAANRARNRIPTKKVTTTAIPYPNHALPDAFTPRILPCGPGETTKATRPANYTDSDRLLQRVSNGT